MGAMPIFVKDPSADGQREAQAAAETVFDRVLKQRMVDTAAFVVAEEGRDPSGGCIKVKSLMQTAMGPAPNGRPELGAEDLAAYVLDKARKLHAIVIERLRAVFRGELCPELSEALAPHLDAARKGDPAALAEIQRLMETPVYDQVDGPSEMQRLIAGVMAGVVKLDPGVNVFADGTVEGSDVLAKRMQSAIADTGKGVKELMVVPRVNGEPRYVPISVVMAGIEGGRNGCRFDAIVEALS